MSGSKPCNKVSSLMEGGPQEGRLHAEVQNQYCPLQRLAAVDRWLSLLHMFEWRDTAQTVAMETHTAVSQCVIHCTNTQLLSVCVCVLQ